MDKILIIEDEIAIADLISMTLNANGYEATYALDGEIGANLMEKGNYDLILLDIMLPKCNGYELLEYAKELEIPVIFITAKGQVKDRIKGLNLGADDYMVKPFEIEELLARVKSVLRRCKKKINIGEIEIDFNTRKITKQEKEIKLTPKEFDLLVYLIENQGKALRREKIFEAVWGDEMEFETRTLDLHIQRIRTKLELKDKIKTIYKVGYILEV